MIAVAMTYVAIGLALGCAWAAAEMRLEPQRGLLQDVLNLSLARSVIVTTLVWPFVLAFTLALLLIKKPKKHDE